jgi:hypothetical protein
MTFATFAALNHMRTFEPLLLFNVINFREATRRDGRDVAAAGGYL